MTGATHPLRKCVSVLLWGVSAARTTLCNCKGGNRSICKEVFKYLRDDVELQDESFRSIMLWDNYKCLIQAAMNRNIKLNRPLLLLDVLFDHLGHQLLGHLHDYEAQLPSRRPFPHLLLLNVLLHLPILDVLPSWPKRQATILILNN